MQSGFPPHTQWEGRASLSVILLEEDTQELPREPAPQSPTGAVHISGKCTKPISSGFTFQLKDPVLIAFCPLPPSPSLLFLHGRRVWSRYNDCFGAAGIGRCSGLQQNKQTNSLYRL